MDSSPPPPDEATTIALQQAEIERLRQRLAQDVFAQDLRDALTTASATGAIGAPVSYRRLLKMILATAADIADASAASLLLVDPETEELVFEVALGERVTPGRFRVAPGQGVAGLVALTAQPMVISDTGDDPHDDSDIAAALGYTPKSLLCVPLSFRDRVIGVLQLFDKAVEDGDPTFGVDDMEAVALFANIGAVAIEQARTHSRMGAMLAELVQQVDGVPDYDRNGLTQRAREFTDHLGRQSGYLDALDMARLVQEIVHHGDAAREACRGILANFAEFLRSRPTAATDVERPW